LFISPDGFCSLTTKLPQILVVPEGYSDENGTIKNQGSRSSSRFINKVQSVITVSEFAKRQILEKYKISEEHVTVIHPAAGDIFHATEPAVQTEVKLQYTQGNEFFLFAGRLNQKNDLVNLLKAFSIFKKRQQSTMKLIIAPIQSTKTKSISELIASYKYRDEVIVINSLDEHALAKLMSSAYAMINLSAGCAIRMLEAMKCEIPVLAIADPAIQEIAGDGAMYFDAADHTDLGEKLMLIYKDEEKRDRLIQNGKIIQAKYTMEKAAGLLWQAIRKAIPTSVD
jgi:glycosyltransferase involved in cell wall biosynthesis